MDPHYQPFKLQAINPKRLPQWQSKSKSTINHCRFETQIKLSIQKVLLPCPSIPYFAFVDLETVFHRVPRKVLWWALRSLGVEKWAVYVIQCISKLKTWKAGMESKGPRVNMKKTKLQVSCAGHDVPKKSDKHTLLSALVVSVATVTVPLLPDVVWPGESSGNSCLS